MKTGFVIALLVVAMLCASSLAQEMTAEDWYKKGQSLIANGSGYNIDDALSAFDNAIQIDPQNIDAWLGKAQSLAYLDKKNESLEAFRSVLNLTNEAIEENPEDAKAWQSKGIALASLGRDVEATDAFEKSIDVLNQSLQSDPKDAEAWWLKAENLELLGRSDSALEAYDEVIALNSSKAVGAWIRKSDIFYGQPGGYNQSQEAFGKAVDLMKVNSTSFISFWYPEGDHTITLNEWMIDGQIIRVDFGRYNKSLQAYDDLVQTRTNYNLFAAWQSKGRAIAPQGRTLGKQNEHLVGSSLNWMVYNFSNFEENSANGWYKKGMELLLNGSYEDAIGAYDKAIEIDPQNSTIWHSKAIAFRDNGEFPEAIEAYSRAAELNPQEKGIWNIQGFLLSELGRYSEANEAYDKAIQDDPESAGAWGNKAEALDNMGRHDEAVRAYERSIEILDNTTKANSNDSNSWAGMGYELMKIGKYDEALEAYDKAIETASSSPSYMIEFTSAKAWAGKGSVLNKMGNYDEALKAFDKALEISPDYTLTFEWKGDALMDQGRYEDALIAYEKAIETDTIFSKLRYKKGLALKALGRQTESDAAFAEAEEQGYEVPNDSEDNSSSTPVKMLAITSIKATGDDEFVEIANSRIVAQSLNGWTLDVSDGRNQSITLPDFTLDPDERINVHLGNGESNETDIFLNSAVILNDTTGNVTLKDEAGKDVASFGYRVEPDGSVTGIMTAEGEFSYPPAGPGDVKMVVREAGSGPYVTERTEYEPEAARLNTSSVPAMALDNTADNTAYGWIDKGNALAEQGNYDEAAKALDNATMRSPQDKHIWMSRGLILAAHMGRYNESIEAYERAIQIDPGDANAWFGKGATLNRTGRYEEASQALNKAIDLNPKLVAAWKVKGDALKALGRNSEADAAYAKAKELGYEG